MMTGKLTDKDYTFRPGQMGDRAEEYKKGGVPWPDPRKTRPYVYYAGGIPIIEDIVDFVPAPIAKLPPAPQLTPGGHVWWSYLPEEKP